MRLSELTRGRLSLVHPAAVWLANAEGILVKLWPKTSPVTGIAADVAEYIRS